MGPTPLTTSHRIISHSTIPLYLPLCLPHSLSLSSFIVASSHVCTYSEEKRAHVRRHLFEHAVALHPSP